MGNALPRSPPANAPRPECRPTIKDAPAPSAASLLRMKLLHAVITDEKDKIPLAKRSFIDYN